MTEDTTNTKKIGARLGEAQTVFSFLEQIWNHTKIHLWLQGLELDERRRKTCSLISSENW